MIENKKKEFLPFGKNSFFIGALNEIRTHTPEPALPPQSSMSTNFTISA
jgi:hypothetical protein